MATTTSTAVLSRADRMALGIAGGVISAVGIGVMFWAGWRVAVGVLLAIWGLRISDEALRLTRDALSRSAATLQNAEWRAALARAESDGYLPVGRLNNESPGAMDVDYVTVDGERVEHVTDLDDVEGWVRYYGPNLIVEGDAFRTFYRTGTVRVHWRRAAPPTRAAA